MRIRTFAVLMVAIAAIVFLAGCVKQDLGGYEGLGKGQIYSFQGPHPGKARIVGSYHVVLYIELPSQATNMEVHGEDNSHFSITFTDKDGIARRWVFSDAIKVSTEQGVYEINLLAVKEVNACAGQCPNYE